MHARAELEAGFSSKKRNLRVHSVIKYAATIPLFFQLKRKEFSSSTVKLFTTIKPFLPSLQQRPARLYSAILGLSIFLLQSSVKHLCQSQINSAIENVLSSL